MNEIKKLTLIEGEFSPDDANDILMNIFSAKINFHQLKNFSSQVRFEKNDEIAQERIPKLKKEIEKLEEILRDAKAKSKNLKISSEISISFAD